MFTKPLIKEIFFLSIIVAFFHYTALTLYLYWTVSWFDILMHLMGGFLMGLIVVSIFIQFLKPEILKHKRAVVILVLSSVLVIGLGWELWELFLGFTDVVSDKLDTIIDIVMDFIGGYFALLYSNKYLWNKN